jgi:hypothetical protein
VDNHFSNTKYCLARLLADKAKDPIHKKVTQAKNIKDMCEALQVEYAEKYTDVVSRGEKSAVAKAAEGIFESRSQVALSMANAA